MKTWIIVLVGIVLFAGIVTTVYLLNKDGHLPSTPSPATTTQTTITTESTTTSTATPTIYFPINDYADRLTKRGYGTHVVVGDEKNFVCGQAFEGYHDGDDLEIFPEEVDQDMPVFAVTNGIVRQVSTVNGYGGLIIVEYNLGGQTVTANYGHVNISRSFVKVGDTVTPGQKIALLGNQCSSQTDGERKHLHFAIHKGSGINVAGYVSSPNQLAAWLDPKSFLTGLGAAEPK